MVGVWYFDILTISMVHVLLILWCTKYFYVWSTVHNLRYWEFSPSSYSIFASVDTAQFPKFRIRYWLYWTILSIWYTDTGVYAQYSVFRHSITNNVHAFMFTYWCPVFPMVIVFFSASFFLNSHMFPLHELGIFHSSLFEWHADARCRSHGVHILMSTCCHFSLCHYSFVSICIAFFYITS